jgi:hypothetical protein
MKQKLSLVEKAVIYSKVAKAQSFKGKESMSDPPNEDEIKQWLSYIPHTGTFIWINGRYKGNII